MKEKSKINPFKNMLDADEEILWLYAPESDIPEAEEWPI
jgi:hypothetical protein